MENRRFFLFAILGVLLFVAFQTWKQDHPALVAPEATTASPATASAPAPLAPGQPVAVGAGAADFGTDTGARLKIQTDRFNAEISLAGGDLRRAELRGYPLHKDQPNQAIALLNEDSAHFFILQSGLAGASQTLSGPNTLFTAPATDFRMADGAATLDVPLTYTNAATGVVLTKTWRFTRGSYKVWVTQTLVNRSGAPVSAAAWARLTRTAPPKGDEPPFSKTFTGVGFYEQKEGGTDYRFVKEALDGLGKKPINASQTGGWLAMIQHYFLVAIIPGNPQDKASFEAKPSPIKGYQGQYYGPLLSVAPGKAQGFSTGFYIGPTLNGVLEHEAPGLSLTEDYGMLAPIAKPLFWALKHFHSWVGNWGVAIILLTLTVKSLMYKLSKAQYSSMAKMKKFAPRIAELKERYADDREKQSKAMMELYTKEGFNPLAGCWPMLVQFPVFISLYWVLSQSVELRQADFMLWLNNLSSPDPFYVLPVLFGASMWFQQKLQGTSMTMDPMQQKMMQFMPVGLTAFFAFFPAGLVLYWFVSNLITIGQMQLINHQLAKEALLPPKPVKPSKPGLMAKMAQLSSAAQAANDAKNGKPRK